MRIGASLFLIALGAILRFAVSDSVKGINLAVIGVVLMIVGAVGLLLTALLMTTRRRTDVVYQNDNPMLVQPQAPAVGPRPARTVVRQPASYVEDTPPAW